MHIYLVGLPEGTLISSYIRRLGSFLGVQNFEFQYFLRFSEILIFFWKWRFCGYFFGSSQNWTVFSMHFGSFLKVKVQNGGYFFGLLKFQIFFGGAWNSWYFFGWTVDAGPEPTYEAKMRVPTLGSGWGLDFLIWAFSYFHTLCMQAAKATWDHVNAQLVLSDSWRLGVAISTKTSPWA